jgi:hypothetical protein
LGYVIRIDADGERGPARLLEWSGGDLPDTWAFQSPASPTPQYLYRMPDGLEPYRTTRKQHGKGHNELALMALGGQTVLPPSLHPSGGAYIWVPGHGPDDLPMAEAPAWLIQRLAQVGKKTSTRRKKVATRADGKTRSLAVDDLKIARPKRELIRSGGDPNGHRSLALYEIYKAMDAAGYSEEEIAGVVCNPDNGISAKPLEQRDPRGWVLGDIDRVLNKLPDGPPDYGDEDIPGDDAGATWIPGYGVRRQHGIRVRAAAPTRRLIRTVDAREVPVLWR